MKKFLLSLLMFVPALAFSGGWQNPGWVVRMLNDFGVDDGSKVYVVFDQNYNPDNCPNNDGHKRIYGATPKGINMIADIRVAIAYGKLVQPFISGCDEIGRPIIVGLALLNR